MENLRLTALHAEMKKSGIDIYLVPTADFHNSEYVGDHFKAREFLTGFTGSAGTAVVTADEAGLWTDGRYFIQAERELSGSGFELYRMGMENVPTVREYVEKALPEGGVIGFDGRVVTACQAEEYRAIVEKKGGSLHTEEDLVGALWAERPPMACTPLWILEEAYSGESAASKLACVRERMEKEGAQWHAVSNLCDIAWILNLRADDIAHCPVFLSYLVIGKDEVTLFVQPAAVPEEVRAYLDACGVRIADYDAVYETLAKLSADAASAKCSEDAASAKLSEDIASANPAEDAASPGPVKTQAILLDREEVNSRVTASLPENMRIIDKANPSARMRAVKNETELCNTRIAHLRDGIAMTKFMYWLKTSVGQIQLDEYTVGCRVDETREQTEHFLDLSFDTICAYGPNAAMMHYAAEKESAARIGPEGFLLVDSGGHYLEGTTDITRTFVLGPVTEEMRRHFTTVARSMLALANARFLSGCDGTNLDILAREPLWELGIDYRCGTGHGVGHLLSVHEGPNGFRWQAASKQRERGTLEPGMITTDEPGVYLEGQYGIRIENELLCVEDEKNEYGQFLRFETITYCPIDLDGIEPSLMSAQEKTWLNDYHKTVYELVAPHLTEEERTWLVKYTEEI